MRGNQLDLFKKNKKKKQLMQLFLPALIESHFSIFLSVNALMRLKY